MKKKQNRNMAGANGYPSEMNNLSRKLTTPALKECFNHVLQGGEAPVPWRQAAVSVISKLGKDKSQCSCYRPISAINIDSRLFASIPAR